MKDRDLFTREKQENRGGNREGQALIDLSLAYEKIYKPESGLWLIIGRFSWTGLACLKTWTDLKAYLQVYFILRSSNSLFGLLNKLNKL